MNKTEYYKKSQNKGSAQEYDIVSSHCSDGPDKTCPCPEVYVLLGYSTASLSICFPAFQDYVVVSLSRVKYASRTTSLTCHNSTVTGFYTKVYNMCIIMCSISVLLHWAVVYIQN
jgi:hypothetical protein